MRQNCANDHRWQEGNHLGDKNASKQGCDPSGGGTSGFGTISGVVFYDMNKTGVYVAGGPGVAGWAVHLSGPVTRDTTADMFGNFTFPNDPAGNYTVCQGQLFTTPWVQSLPANNGCYTVALVAGGVSNTNYFGFYMQF